MPTVQHRRFDGGMNQDEASFLLPEGEVYFARNMLFDKVGIARKRGGISGLGATTTYNGDNIGVLVRDDGSEQLYSAGSSGGGGPRIISSVDSSTGAFTAGSSINGDALPDGGRPFQHYGFLMFPNYGGTAGVGSPNVSPAAAAGSVTGATYFFTTPNSVVMTAGDKRITCAAADDPTTKFTTGDILSLQYGAAFQNLYVGRVTRRISTTAFEVFPTPVSGNAGTAAGATIKTSSLFESFYATQFPNNFQRQYVSSKVGMSFQGRAVLANLGLYDAGGFGRLEINPRGVFFSTLLLEQPFSHIVSVPANEETGALWLMAEGYPTLNYFNIPAQEAITAMSPTGFGDAVIFSAFRTFRLTGNLTTQYGTTQSITWAIREIPNSVGCISERSMQRSPRGVVFAHDSGVYVTDGQNMHPLMNKKMTDYWKALVTGGSFLVYGSALIRGNHYYICGRTGAGALFALMVNLDTLAWGTINGKVSAPSAYLINSSVQDAISPGRTWGLKWWDQSAANPSMTGGQLLKLDDMFQPSSSNRADSDTTQVTFDLVTKPYVEDSPTIQKTWLAATIEYLNQGGAGITIEPHFVLDSVDATNPTAASATSLAKQDVYTVSAGTGANVLIVLTIGAHTIQPDDWVRVAGVLGNTAANGLWRVQAIGGGNTTITLQGSIGNAAYSSGGTAQIIDTKDISLQLRLDTLPNSNPVGVAYRIQDSGASGSDKFEFYGVTHTYEDRDPHVE